MKRHKEIQPISYEDSLFLEDIYSQHSRYMLNVAKVFTKKDKMKAEDVMHDAIIRLISCVPKLRELERSKLRAYLRVTIKTTYLDNQKKENRWVSLSEEFLQNVADKEQELEPDLFLDWKLQRLKEELTPREWMALEQKFILGYSNEEIAAVLCISPDSVRMTLSRIYKRSREILPEGVR